MKGSTYQLIGVQSNRQVIISASNIDNAGRIVHKCDINCKRRERNITHSQSPFVWLRSTTMKGIF